MQEAYRLLRETLWYLEAEEDPDYSPHTLNQQRLRLREMIERQLYAMEADSKWSTQNDPGFYFDQKLPSGWFVQVQEPSRRLRFTARSPETNGYSILVLASDPDVLVEKVGLYSSIIDKLKARAAARL